MYKLIKKDGNAKRGEFHTVHGVIQTPVFMNVGTVAAIKGAVSTEDLEQIKTQVELSNTYHLHVRPGDQADQRIRRTAQIYGMGQANLNGFRRISGVFSGKPYERLKKKAFISIPMWTAEKFLWDRRRVCRSSPISLPRSPWHLMSVPSSVAERSYVENSVAPDNPLVRTLQKRNGTLKCLRRYHQ